MGFLQAIYAGWPFIIAAILAAIIGTAGGTSGGTVAIVVVIWILGGIPSLVLYTRYALALPTIAVEGLTAGSAIDRSVSLTEGGRWRIFWGIAMPAIPSLGLVFGVSGLMETLKNGNALLASNPMLVAGINGIVELITTLVFTPYGFIVLTLLYYDQRIRREGFDVERMMQAAGLDANATPSTVGE
jgi:hypothetical protein